MGTGSGSSPADAVRKPPRTLPTSAEDSLPGRRIIAPNRYQRPDTRCWRSRTPWSGNARPLCGTRFQAYREPWLLLMGKEKGFALTSIRAREMRRVLERAGYVVEPGQHKHLKLRHEQLGDVLLPLRPSDNLSHVALKQIAKAMGLTPEELMRRVK